MAAGERLPLTERVFYAYSAVSRWLFNRSAGSRAAGQRANRGSQTAMASATSLSSLAVSFGAVVGERLSEATGPSWLSWAGQYDLAFIRPGGSQTDPGAALASRTCGTCGATYRSELATTCANCKAPRPLPWGEWRLADLTPVE